MNISSEKGLIITMCRIYMFFFAYVFCVFMPTCSRGQVELIDKEGFIYLSNDVIALKIKKQIGKVVSMKSLKDESKRELIGDAVPGIQFDCNYRLDVNNFNTPSIFWWIRKSDYRCIEQNKNFVEIAFKTATDVNFPFSADIHYVLKDNDSGFYFFTVLEHGAAFQGMILEQARFCVCLDPDVFKWQAVDDNRQALMPFAHALRARQVLDPPEAGLLADGSVYYKYDWCLYEYEHNLMSLMGDEIGVHVISSSSEYVNGGPSRQELTVHQTETIGPVMQRVFQARHNTTFDTSTLLLKDNESWSKLYGPCFIYVNQGECPKAIWDDAKSRAMKEKKDWPYSWMNNPLYPVKRGSLKGRILTPDHKPVSDAWVILGQSEPDWQLQSKDYLYWDNTDSNGCFNVEKIRPGTYTMFICGGNVWGQHKQEKMQIGESVITDAGTIIWKPLEYGRKLWQIGVLDRTAGEFRHGQEVRHWGRWLPYTTDFPNDVNFTVGKSIESINWNYLQPSKSLGNDQSGPCSWHINFFMDEEHHGNAVISIGIASAYNARLCVLVNGLTVFEKTLISDSAARYGANQGFYRLEMIPFDASLLKPGKNRITLVQASTNKAASILYDSIKLELAHFENEKAKNNPSEIR